MENSDFWIRTTNLCGSKTPPVVFACKTATSGPVKQVSMGPIHDLSFCSCTTACLASEFLVSMAPSTLLWFLHANSDFWTRITNLYGSQTLPVVFCMQYNVIRTRITCLYGSQPLSVVFSCKTLYLSQTSPVTLCWQNSVISIRNTSLYWSPPSSVDFGCETATFGSE